MALYSLQYPPMVLYSPQHLPMVPYGAHQWLSIAPNTHQWHYIGPKTHQWPYIVPSTGTVWCPLMALFDSPAPRRSSPGLFPPYNLPLPQMSPTPLQLPATNTWSAGSGEGGAASSCGGRGFRRTKGAWPVRQRRCGEGAWLRRRKGRGLARWAGLGAGAAVAAAAGTRGGGGGGGGASSPSLPPRSVHNGRSPPRRSLPP